MLMIFQSSVERRQVAELRVLRNQYYSAEKSILQCWTPEDLRTQESGILWGAVQTLHSLDAHILPSSFLKELDGKQSPKVIFRCSAGGAVFITAPGLCLCCVSTSSCFIYFPCVSYLCVWWEIFWEKKKIASAFLLLSLTMADGSSVSERSLPDFD